MQHQADIFEFKPQPQAGSLTSAEEATIQEALAILGRQVKGGPLMTGSKDTSNYLRLKYSREKSEHFGVLFLDCAHNVLAEEILFHGTLDGCAVYPRIVLERALACNAGACIAFHNHPSGNSTPSHADRHITRRLADALGLVDCRLLDHIVVGVGSHYSFAENGEMG